MYWASELELIKTTMVEHISTTFYQCQFSATILWWLVVRVMTRMQLYEITNGSVFTKPSWLSCRFLHHMQSPSRRKVIFVASVLAMGVAGWGFPFVDPKWMSTRLVTALVVSLYHLVESSVTHRHGESSEKSKTRIPIRILLLSNLILYCAT